MEEIKIKTIKDVEEVEKTQLDEKLETIDTYSMIRKGATINPDAPAITFLLNGDAYENPLVVNYQELIHAL